MTLVDLQDDKGVVNARVSNEAAGLMGRGSSSLPIAILPNAPQRSRASALSTATEDNDGDMGSSFSLCSTPTNTFSVLTKDMSMTDIQNLKSSARCATANRTGGSTWTTPATHRVCSSSFTQRPFTPLPRCRSAQESICLSVRSDVASHHAHETHSSDLPWWEAAKTDRSKVWRPLQFWAEERRVRERGVLQKPRPASMCSRSGSSPDFSPGAPCTVGESSSSSDNDDDLALFELEQVTCKRAPHEDQWAALVRIS